VVRNGGWRDPIGDPIVVGCVRLDLSARTCRTFVPEGLADRSQAIYCLEHVQPRIRPVGNGLILT
jgi:hypothetical protein